MGLLCEDGKLPMPSGSTNYDRRWGCTLRRLHKIEHRGGGSEGCERCFWMKIFENIHTAS
jgi:hypothetical protein